MSFEKPSRAWKRGDPISASRLEHTRQQAEQASGVSSSDIEILQGQKGRGLGVRRFAIPTPATPGVIVNAGPTGQADFTDNRYWVKLMTMAPYSGGPTTLLPQVPLETGVAGQYSGFYWIPVTNLAESPGNTHNLPTDGSRGGMIYTFFDRDGQIHWVMSEGGAGGALPPATFLGAGLYVVAMNTWGVDYLVAIPPVTEPSPP